MQKLNNARDYTTDERTVIQLPEETVNYLQRLDY